MTMPLAAAAGPYETTTTSMSEYWQPYQQTLAADRSTRRLLTQPLAATLSLSRSKVTVHVYQPEPDWFYPTLSRFQHLTQLSENWDSYGGRPPQDEAVFTALALIARLLIRDRSVPPAIVPTSEGGVQLEWQRDGDELDIRVKPNGEISAFRFNEAAGQGAEVDHVSLSDLAPLLALTGQP